jgi:hypothetical protein
MDNLKKENLEFYERRLESFEINKI